MARFGIIGGGLMGHGIAVAVARRGHQARVYDRDPSVLGTLGFRVERALGLAGLSGERGADIQRRIAGVTGLAEAVEHADIVVEAVSERLHVKHEVLATAETVAPPDIPIWSNTSVLPVTEIAEGLRGPERLVGVHWWNPPYLVPLVEIAPGGKTDHRFVEAAEELLNDLGKTTVRLARDVPGFIGNRLQFALIREALHLVAEDVCDAETVDTVVRSSFGLRLAAVGPMENADYIGLDLTRSILANLAPRLATRTGSFPPIEQLLREGDRGSVSGKGLLSWPPGRGEEVARRLTDGVRRNLDGLDNRSTD